MGFLLSKLLPLLVYPLGLGLLLQLAGLGSGRKAKLSRALGASGVAVIWLFAMPVTSRQLIWGLGGAGGGAHAAGDPQRRRHRRARRRPQAGLATEAGG